MPRVSDPRAPDADRDLTAAAPSGDVREARPARRNARYARALAWPLAVFVANAVAAAVLLRLWEADMRLAFNYYGDELFSLMTIKDVIDNGWFLTNPDIGAPLGQHLHDFAGVNGDSFTMLIAKLLGVFTSNPALVQNGMFIASFPAIAVITFLVLRALGVGAAAAAVVATLFALAPYHLLRGKAHFFLALYYTVPLGGYLVLSVFSGRPLFGRRRAASSRWATWASGRTLGTLAICAVVASGGVYYAFFSVLLLATATAVRLLVTRTWTAAATGCAVIVAIGVVMVANQAPTLIYQSQHGVNELVGKRLPVESEIYSLKLTRLVLPVPGHRIDALSRITDRYVATPTSSPGELGSSEALGTLGTIGFAWLLLVLVLGAVRPRLRAPFDERHGHAAVAALVCFLFGTTGGAAALLAFLISPQLRGSNRISIFIAFFSLFAVALLLDALVRRLRARGTPVAVVGLLLGGIMLLALYDQTNRTHVPLYSVTKAEYGNDRAFVAAIDEQMPPGAEIFQLPYIPFPGNPPVGALPDQDLLRPYLQSSDLRWSYGAMKGRPEDWADDFFGLSREQVSAVRTAPASDRPLRTDTAALVASGFEGIYIDRFGYADRAAALERELSAITGVQPLVSPNGRMSFFSLLGAPRSATSRLDPAQRAALRHATLRPLSATFGAGFYAAEPVAEGVTRWARRDATLQIDNPGPAARAVFDTLVAGTPRPSRMTFRRPGGRVIVRRVAPAGLRLRLPIVLAPGRNRIAISTDAPQTPSAAGDGRVLFMRFVNPRVVDPRRTPSPP